VSLAALLSLTDGEQRRSCDRSHSDAFVVEHLPRLHAERPSKAVWARINPEQGAQLQYGLALFGVEAAIGVGDPAARVDEKVAFARALDESGHKLKGVAFACVVVLRESERDVFEQGEHLGDSQRFGWLKAQDKSAHPQRFFRRHPPVRIGHERASGDDGFHQGDVCVGEFAAQLCRAQPRFGALEAAL